MLRKYNHYVRLTLHVTAGPTNEFYDLDKAIDRVTHTCGVMCGVKAENRTIPTWVKGLPCTLALAVHP